MSASITPVEMSFRYRDKKVVYDKKTYAGDEKLLIRDELGPEFLKLTKLAGKFTFKANPDCFNPENVSRVSLAAKAVLEAKKKLTIKNLVCVMNEELLSQHPSIREEHLNEAQGGLDAAEASFKEAQRSTGIEVLFQEDEETSSAEAP